MALRKPAALFLLLVLSVTAADDARHLVFSQKIGEDWPVEISAWVNFVAISADGTKLASNGRTPSGKPGDWGMWPFPSGDFLRTIPAGVLSLDFKLIATEEGIVELDSGKPLAGFSKPYQLGTFSPNGKLFAEVHSPHSDSDRRSGIIVVQTSAGEPIRSFGTHATDALAIHPDNQTLASGHWDNVVLWNLRTGQRLGLLGGIGRYVVGVAFSPDGRILAATTDNGGLQLWDVATRRRLHTAKIGTSEVSIPAFSPDGKLVAAGTYDDGTVSLVDVASGTVQSQIQVSMFGCGAMAFSPDGGFLVTPSNWGILNSGKISQGGSTRVFRVSPGSSATLQ